MSINNLELIKPLLTFDNKDDFYMLYVFKRKKDQPEGEKENSQSVRTIKYYLVDSVEYLEKRWEEIVHLCEFFKARAYIHVQKQNHKEVGLAMMEHLARRIRSGAVKQHNLFESIVGKIEREEKRWIVDIDTKNEEHLENVIHVINTICRPINVDKIITKIPTKNGVHLITKRFSTEDFEASGLTEDLQKKNPTLLYLPDSLH